MAREVQALTLLWNRLCGNQVFVAITVIVEPSARLADDVKVTPAGVIVEPEYLYRVFYLINDREVQVNLRDLRTMQDYLGHSDPKHTVSNDIRNCCPPYCLTSRCYRAPSAAI